MQSLNITRCTKHGVKHKVHQVQRKQIEMKEMYVQNVHHWQSPQARLPLVNCVINQRLLQAAPHI